MNGAGKLLAEWFWTDRWIGSSAFLLPIEPRGLYREMLTQAWRRGGRLPNNYEAIRRAIGCTVVEWKRCWPLVERYWRVEGGDLINDTQVEIWAEAHAAHLRAVDRGRKGGRAKAGRRQTYGVEQAQEQVEEQLVEQAVAQGVLEHEPPSPSPSLYQQTPKGFPGTAVDRDRVDPVIAEKAGRFLERYPEIYAKARSGAHYLLRPARDFAYACQLVAGWPDDAHLDRIAELFLVREDIGDKNKPGTPGQLLHMAPDCDSLLRKGARR